ncbi:glycerol-3-phosphate-acyltransferase [Mycena floridula]|nr:glycerol-3-phosphate-acyltransferase [Mycena floridula]
MAQPDGAAWAALAYTKYIIPAAIVYTNKSKYKSDVVMEFGPPITMDAYREQFFSVEEGAARAAMKRLTKTIERRLVERSVNAGDWDTLYVARIARDILWEGDRTINLDEFVQISQTLVDLFSTPNATSNMTSTRRSLLQYYSLLQSTHLTNSVLSTLPLPRSLDPNTPASLPSRLYTLAVLMRDTATALIQLPFFVFPLIVHVPVYFMGKVGGRLVEDEEETMAQNKLAFGVLGLLVVYPAMFWFLWAFLTPSSTSFVSAIIAFATVWVIAAYHNRIVGGNYERMKRFLAAWRVLVGIWAPRSWEMNMGQLEEFRRPVVPKESEWIGTKTTTKGDSSKEDVKTSVLLKTPELSTVTEPPPSISPLSSPSSLSPSSSTPSRPPLKTRKSKRPPSRRIMRHVLRARIEAVKALASFFEELERGGQAKRVGASEHLGRAFGGVERREMMNETTNPIKAEEEIKAKAEGDLIAWRSATEVISYLRKRGAKIPTVAGGNMRLEEEWGVSSDAEGES